MTKIITLLKQLYVKTSKFFKQIYVKTGEFLKKNYGKVTTHLNRCNNRLFWITLILSAGVFVSILIFWKSSINLVPVSVIVALLLMYCFSDTHHHAIMNKEGFLYPLFITLGTSFALICFIIHLHGDVFISYDTTGNQPDKYKWFEAKEILDFPIKQFESSENPLPQNIDFLTIKDKNPKPLYHIIIIDKTGSVKNSYPGVNSYLKKEISNVFKVADQKEFNGFQTSDLIPAYIAANLFENLEKDKTNNDNIGFVCFSGINNDFTFLDAANPHANPYTDNIKEIKKHKSQFISRYIRQLKIYKDGLEQKGRKATQKTSFKQIFASLGSFFKTEQFKRPYDKRSNKIEDSTIFHVTFISDFINTDSTEAVPDLDLIRKIKLLNLYILKGFDPQSPNSSPYNLIKKATKRYSCLKEIKTIDFQEYEKGDTDTFYKTLAILNFRYFDHKTDSNICVYSPYEDFHTQNGVKARLTFKNSDRVADSIYFKIGNLDHPNDLYQFYYYKNSDSLNYIVVNPNELASVLVTPSDTLNLRMPTATSYKSDRLFVELSNKRVNKMESRMISILPLLSKTTSYFLLILFTVFVISISLVLILTNSFVFCLIDRGEIECPHWFHTFVMSISTGLGFAILIFFYIELFKIFSLKDRSISCAVLVVLVLFPFFHLLRDLKNFKKEEKRFTSFQKWITERIEQKSNEMPPPPNAAAGNNTNFSRPDASTDEGQPAVDQNNSQPLIINFEGFYKIKNILSDTYIIAEKGLPTSRPIEDHRWSAQWKLTRILPGINNFSIKKKGKQFFLGINNGSVILSENNEAAANIWTLEQVGDTDSYRINNTETKHYLSIIDGDLTLSDNPNDQNSIWLFEQF